MKPTATAVPNTDYRSDIDGLRGIAVLSVILYHINSALAPGGFVGVDIFFVISGYLISLHIFSEIESNRFSLAEFYRRRIKRIAPAMLVVVAITLAITQFLFVPDDAEVASEAAFFSLLSLANVYFWKFLDASYFAASTDEQPFLHLWSLGVEEQFYILWPLILLAFYRGRHTAGFFLLGGLAAVASFALGDILFPRDSSLVYYMLPTRAGELLLGAIAAQWILRHPRHARAESLAPWLSALGAVLVVGSCYWTSESQAFPGWRALPPTMGSAFLIVAGQYRGTWPTRILQWRPLVAVGVVSYSAYLWHWPILSIPRYYGIEFGALLGATAFVATLILAWLSYRYVERPARRTKDPFIRVAWKQYVLPAGTLAMLCILVKLSDGFGARILMPDLRDKLTAAELETQAAFESDYICQRQELRPADFSDRRCIVGPNTDAEPIRILWGDSNAAHYVGMLGAFANDQGYSFRNVIAMGCQPVFFNMEKVANAKKRPLCSASASSFRAQFERYQEVWIAADWLTYDRNSTYFLESFDATLREIARDGRRVTIIGKAPKIRDYDRRCPQKAALIPTMQCRYPAVPMAPEVVSINEKMAGIAARTPGVTYFDANDWLCPHGTCPVVDESGKLNYYDSSHISLDASWRLGQRILGDGVPDVFRAER